MDVPLSGMVDHSCANLYKPPYYRVYKWSDALAPERGIPNHVEQLIGIIAVLIARRHLIDPLAQHLEQGMIRVAWQSRVIDPGRHTAEGVEPLIALSHEKKAGISGDLCALKINANGFVEIWPYGPCLFVTNCAHAAFPPFD